MAKSLGVPYRVSVRLDDELRDRLSAFIAANEMTLAQAARTVLSVGLRTVEETPERAFSRAAFREGVSLGLGAFKRAVMDAASTALARIDEAS